ncbi:MAG: tetratricopeptide repeat protein [Gemmatimonadota bacterium]
MTPSAAPDPAIEQGLTLRLFGAPSFTGAGAERASELLGKPKAFAVLAYLALGGAGGFRRRDALLALFWPEADTTRARNALRQSLFLLRQHLPAEALVTGPHDSVGLATHAVRVDVNLFSAHLEQSRARDGLALYRGPLLDGFSPYASADFTAWLGMERGRVQQRATRAALSLAQHGAAHHEAADANAWLHWALQHAPYDEDLLRAAIELLHKSGDRAGATSLYDAAAERFQADLGIALSPETQYAGRVATVHASGRAAVHASADVSLAATKDATAASPAAAPTVLRPRLVSPESRRSHLQARQFAGQRSPLTIMKAIESYEHALKLSPEYAEAHAGLGFALCQANVYVDYPGSDAWPRAKAHATRAIRLDPRLGEAHAVLAQVTLCYDYDWAGAKALFGKALEVDPASGVARLLYALYYLTSIGDTDAALAILDRARDDMPDNPALSVYYAMCCVFGRRFEFGLQEAEFVLQSHPSLVQATWVRGMALEGMGDLPGAIASFESGVAQTGRSSLFLSQLGRASASAGDHARATAILHELDERGGDSGLGLYSSAEILAAMGETDRAMDCLYSAYRQRNPFMIFAGVKYALDPLRGTKRFRELLTRMGMPTSAQAMRHR